MDTPLKIKVIIGSTRQGRFSEKPAQWIFDEVKKKEGVEVELLDLRDYPMPFFEEAVTPSAIKEPYANPIVQRWTQKIADGDAFIIATAEYSHGYPAVLKNALDYVYKEWNKKAVGFVGWGSVAGGRAIEQLREVVIELQMAPIRTAIHIPWQLYLEIAKANPPVAAEIFTPLEATKETFLNQLLWWGKALKTARDADAVSATK